MQQSIFKFVSMGPWVLAPSIFAALVLLGLALFFFIRKRLPQARFIYWFFFLYFIMVFTRAFYYVYAQYTTWVINPLSQHLLPPYVDWGYFIGYVWYHFLLSPVLNLVLAYFWWWILLFLKKRSGGLWLDRADAALGFLTVMFVGWPNFIVYIGVLFIIMVLGLLAAKLLRLPDFRLALTWPMLIAALVVLLLGDWLIVSLGGVALKI